jgi:hypothetical protein
MKLGKRAAKAKREKAVQGRNIRKHRG